MCHFPATLRIQPSKEKTGNEYSKVRIGDYVGARFDEAEASLSANKLVFSPDDDWRISVCRRSLLVSGCNILNLFSSEFQDRPAPVR